MNKHEQQQKKTREVKKSTSREIVVYFHSFINFEIFRCKIKIYFRLKQKKSFRFNKTNFHSNEYKNCSEITQVSLSLISGFNFYWIYSEFFRGSWRWQMKRILSPLFQFIAVHVLFFHYKYILFSWLLIFAFLKSTELAVIAFYCARGCLLFCLYDL